MHTAFHSSLIPRLFLSWQEERSQESLYSGQSLITPYYWLPWIRCSMIMLMRGGPWSCAKHWPPCIIDPSAVQDIHYGSCLVSDSAYTECTYPCNCKLHSNCCSLDYIVNKPLTCGTWLMTSVYSSKSKVACYHSNTCACCTWVCMTSRFFCVWWALNRVACCIISSGHYCKNASRSCWDKGCRSVQTCKLGAEGTPVDKCFRKEHFPAAARGHEGQDTCMEKTGQYKCKSGGYSCWNCRSWSCRSKRWSNALLSPALT